MGLNQADWLIPATLARCDMDPSHGGQVDEVVLRLVLRTLQGNVGRVFLIRELNLTCRMRSACFSSRAALTSSSSFLRRCVASPLRRATRGGSSLPTASNFATTSPWGSSGRCLKGRPRLFGTTAITKSTSPEWHQIGLPLPDPSYYSAYTKAIVKIN